MGKQIIQYLIILTVLILQVSCSKDNSNSRNDNSSSVGNTGVGGSLARFTITNDHLYTISETNISIFDVSNANDPLKKNTVPLGFGIETIFPKDDYLFIGTQTGMKILDVKNPTTPFLLSDFQHIRSCDPVVANDKYAYVTLRNGNSCTRGLNELQIVDISNIKQPFLFKAYQMSKPYGLALDGDKLFICDQGIKYYDATNPGNLILKKTFSIDAEDLIANQGILMAIGSDGLSQYDYSSGDLVFLSLIPTTL